ncbi:MAG: amidohydrolase family protein, partial [Planctomycetota bacterium]|nr:amidohydrolase family protein [Planctomycetota bacterium]
MALLIKGGRIITATDDFVGDVYCAGETITRVAARIEEGSLKGAGDLEVIDATGKYVFPGFIDPHVHIHLPFMGTLAKDDWASASRAALLGGTTTLLEMVCPAPDAAPLGAFEEWRGKADGRAAVDYGFHMGVVRFDDEAKGQLERIATEFGNPSFKVFLAYKGALNISDEDLFETLSLAKRLGVVVTAHCENADLIAAMQARLIGEGKTGPEWHEPSRPVEVEALGVRHL